MKQAQELIKLAGDMENLENNPRTGAKDWAFPGGARPEWNAANKHRLMSALKGKMQRSRIGWASGPRLCAFV
jgi:hypothetical protein